MVILSVGHNRPKFYLKTVTNVLLVVQDEKDTHIINNQ